MNFSTLDFPFMFSLPMFTKVGCCACCVFQCFCVVYILEFGSRIIELKFSPFSLFFSHLSSLSLSFFFSFPLNLLSCCLASLSCSTTLRPHPTTSSCYLATLLCLVLPQVATSFRYFVVTLPLPRAVKLPLLLPLVALLPFGLHYTSSTFQPPHLLFHCLATSCFIALLSCYLTTLCWLVFPFSRLFCNEELEAWRSELSNNQKTFVLFYFYFLGAQFSFVCFDLLVVFFF